MKTPPPDSLIPEWDAIHPRPATRNSAVDEPKESASQRYVLQALRSRPRSDREVHRWVVEHVSDAKAGTTTLSAVERAIDGLVKRGKVADTGQRGQWTARGREIIWSLTDAAR